MSASAQLPEALPLLLPALGGGLVLVVFIRETRRLLAMLIREVSRHLQDLRWLEAAVQSLRGLPPGSKAELECGSRRMRIEVPGQVPAPSRDADVVPLDRLRKVSGEDLEDRRLWFWRVRQEWLVRLISRIVMLFHGKA